MLNVLPVERRSFHIEFELRPVENRNQTIKQGTPIFDDVEYAIITMPGGQTRVDKEITPELLDEWQHGKGRNDPVPFAVVQYDAWKSGLEVPVNGIDLKNWPGVTPAQLKTCQGAHILTVEDLASINADGLRKLGMGGVALHEKAKAFLGSAETNKNSEAIADLTLKLNDAMDAINSKDDQIGVLMDQVESLQEQIANPPKKRRGRPPKVRDG